MNSALLRLACAIVMAVMLVQCESKLDLGKAEGPPVPDNTWHTYTSPDELYSLHFPVGWHLEEEGNNLTIRPPDSTGAVIITANVGEEPIDDFLQAWLDEAFKSVTPISEPERFLDNGWVGVRRRYRDTPNELEWIGLAANRGEVFVLVSAADASRRWAEREPILEEILGSLVLHGE